MAVPTITVRLEDEETVHTLNHVPLSFEDLRQAVHALTGATTFTVKWNELALHSTQDLFTVYLEHQSDSLQFIVDEVLEAPGVTGQVTDPTLYAPFPVSNGTVRKEHLIALIREISYTATQRLLANSLDACRRRAEVYSVDEAKWRSVVFEQLAFQQSLMKHCIEQSCRNHAVTPAVFDESCRQFVQDPQVAAALQQLSSDALDASVAVPESLTKQKLRDILDYGFKFVQSYVLAHPLQSPQDSLLLRFREGDEVLKKFGFTELEVEAAVQHYGVETGKEWKDIKRKLSLKARITARYSVKAIVKWSMKKIH